MPLVKSASKEAFRKNVKAEMAAGKPQKQAVAIAYSTQRAASSTQRAASGTQRAASGTQRAASGTKSAPKGKK